MTAPAITPQALRVLVNEGPGGTGKPRTYQVRRTMVVLLWDLIENGPVEDDKTGRATLILADRIGYQTANRGRQGRHTVAKSFLNLLWEMERAGAIERLIEAKRTYRIEGRVTGPMMAEAHLPRDAFARQAPALTVVPRGVEPVRDHSPAPAASIPQTTSSSGPVVESEGEDLDGVGLLIEAVRLISRAVPMVAVAGAPPAPEVDPEVLVRLSTALEDAQRARSKLRLAEDQIRALVAERDGLRKARQALEANLSELARGRLDERAYRRYVDLDRMIRTPPGTTKGADSA